MTPGCIDIPEINVTWSTESSEVPNPRVILVKESSVGRRAGPRKISWTSPMINYWMKEIDVQRQESVI